MAAVNVSIISVEPDEATNIEITKYLVDFKYSERKRTADDQAVGE